MNAVLERLAERFGIVLPSVSPRERALLAVLSLIAAVYIGILLFDWSQSLRGRAADARAAHAQAVRARDARAEGSTRARVDAELGKLRDLAFFGETVAIARLRSQSAIEQIAAEAGIRAVRVTGTQSEETSSAVQAHLVTLQGGFDWASFIVLLEKLSNLEQSVTVVSAAADSTAANSFQLVLRVLVAEGG